MVLNKCDFDVRGQKMMDFFTGSLEEVLLWIKDWYFGQKQQFKVKIV